MMSENKQSIIKKPVFWIVAVAIILCIITIIGTMQSNDKFKLTYRDETINYKIEDMPWHTMPERTYEDKMGNESYLDKGEYIDVDANLFKSVPIWNFLSITYVKEDGSKVKYESDAFYHTDGILVGDELYLEEDASITVIHYDITIEESEENGNELYFDKVTKINDVVEIIVEAPNYK